MAINVSGFNVPATPYRETSGLDDLYKMQQDNRRWQYQMAKDKEAEDWRKAALVRNLTDLSDYKTGDDVADAVGNHLMTNVFQKYSAAARDMSPFELQSGIQKDMSGIISGMSGIKDELATADKQGAALKQMYPNLNTAQLYDDYRKEIVNRHLDNTGDNFKNPMQIGESSFDLQNPDFLSKYITGQSNIRDFFANPKGLDDTTVFKGSPYSYTEYKAKIAPWRTPNFNPAQLKEGFLPNNAQEPSLGFKTTTLPSDALPSSNSKPFEMMDDNVYKNLGPKEKLELISATRQKFPTYDNFNPTEKDYAQKNVMADIAKTYDQTNFHPTERKNPSASMLKLYMGKTGDETNVRDVYNEISNKADSHKEGYVPLVDLTTGAQSIALKQARDLSGDNNIAQKDIYVSKYPDGKLYLKHITTEGKVSPNDPVIGEMDFGSTNLPAQPGIKEKRQVIKEGNQQQSVKKGKLDNL